MIKGIHHISAIASDAQKTVDFYTHILGLRLVKQTVNQDDPGTYHLFFGDDVGTPGMDLTFFIFLPARQGTNGNGLVSKVSFSVRVNALTFWQKRFDTLCVPHKQIYTLHGTRRLIFYDPDHLQLELVETDMPNDDLTHVWSTTEVAKKYAIHSFYGATLQVSDHRTIEPVLTNIFGYTSIDAKESTRLYKTTFSSRANSIEILETPEDPIGRNAAGTVHHIAFRAKDRAEQNLLREQIVRLGLSPTETIDRFYFASVYFRTTSGILFEIATDGPGFTADQSEKDLGSSLSLPPFLQPYRKEIEANLPKLQLKHS